MLYNIHFLNNNKTPFIQGYFAQQIQEKTYTMIYKNSNVKNDHALSFGMPKKVFS